MENAYHKAQKGMANLKSAIYQVLSKAPDEGLRNAEIGRTLGIYSGHVGHEGHVPRTLLAIMENEGVVEQNRADKKWKIKKYSG